MNLEFLKTFTNTDHWALLSPELGLVALGLILLLVDLFAGKLKHKWVPSLSIFGQLLILCTCVFQWVNHPIPTTVFAFSGMIGLDYTTQYMRIFFLLSSLLVTILGNIYFVKQRAKHLSSGEFYFLTLFATAALMILVESCHFVLFFMALETVTISFYVLVGYCRESSFSLEAGLKYLILGALSSALLLFGIVLLYGAAGNSAFANFAKDAFNFRELAPFIESNAYNPLVLIGVTLILTGVAFKIGAVPFQIWIPDVYQGAPTPVTAFLAVASKSAGFVVLFNLIRGPFAGLSSFIYVILTVFAVASIIFSNFAALSQRNVKRLIGLSGISHAGYILIGVAASLSIPWAYGAVMFYLLTYLLASFLVFAVMAKVSTDHDEAQNLEDYIGLAKRQPSLAFILTIGLGSLAGIPPLAGFIAKLLIFIAAFQAGLYGLLGVGVVGVILSIYYYFGWIREALFRSWYVSQKPSVISEEFGAENIHLSEAHPTIEANAETPSKLFILVFGIIAAAVVVLGLYQAWITRFFFMSI